MLLSLLTHRRGSARHRAWVIAGCAALSPRPACAWAVIKFQKVLGCLTPSCSWQTECTRGRVQIAKSRNMAELLETLLQSSKTAQQPTIHKGLSRVSRRPSPWRAGSSRMWAHTCEVHAGCSRSLMRADGRPAGTGQGPELQGSGTHSGMTLPRDSSPTAPAPALLHPPARHGRAVHLSQEKAPPREHSQYGSVHILDAALGLA